MSTDRDAALAAYAAPIVRHAQEYAAGVLDSIECDVAHGATADLAAGLEDVSPREELASSRVLADLHVPAGASAWASDVWLLAFAEALADFCAGRVDEAKARGEALIRGHLRSIDAHETRAVRP